MEIKDENESSEKFEQSQKTGSGLEKRIGPKDLRNGEQKSNYVKHKLYNFVYNFCESLYRMFK